jgi:23S rRNA (cytidine1920-2'-O)/16S rRNA (cytidine1409-2'-O)-methyltransferase
VTLSASLPFAVKSKPKPPAASTKSQNRAAARTRIRIDALLVQRGLTASIEHAQALLLAGQVRVNEQKSDKPGTLVAPDARVELAPQPRYVSRGGLKLEGAMDDFGITPEGKVCVDIGSSTGGFADCLLQRGAAKVYAVDVTTDQLDWKLRQNAKVVVVKQNARFLRPEDIGKLSELIVVDVSFISATKILPVLPAIAALGADFLILVKPQFELPKGDVGKGGIVSDPSLHDKAIRQMVDAASELRFEICGVKPSRLQGAEGNQEFFLHARRSKLE